jgi:hypothetical protein
MPRIKGCPTPRRIGRSQHQLNSVSTIVIVILMYRRHKPVGLVAETQCATFSSTFFLSFSTSWHILSALFSLYAFNPYSATLIELCVFALCCGKFPPGALAPVRLSCNWDPGNIFATSDVSSVQWSTKLSQREKCRNNCQ